MRRNFVLFTYGVAFAALLMGFHVWSFPSAKPAAQDFQNQAVVYKTNIEFTVPGTRGEAYYVASMLYDSSAGLVGLVMNHELDSLASAATDWVQPLPKEPTPMIVHWSESVYRCSGGFRCESVEEAWDAMYLIMQRNLDSGLNYSVWMEEEKTAPVNDETSSTKYQSGLSTALHVERVVEMSRNVLFLATWTDVSSDHDEHVLFTLKAIRSLNIENDSVISSILKDSVDKPSAPYDEFIDATIGFAWRELYSSLHFLNDAIKSRDLARKACIRGNVLPCYPCSLPE